MRTILAVAGIGGGLLVMYNAASNPQQPVLQLLYGVLFPLTALLSLRWLRLGKDRPALLLFIWGFFIVSLVNALLVAGVRTPNMSALALTALLSAWLLGARHGYLMAGIAIAFVLALGVAQQAGWVSFSSLRSPLYTAIVLSIYLLITGLFGVATSTEIREENRRNAALSASLAEELAEHQRHELRFQQLFLGNPAPSQIGTPDGTIVAVNDAWVSTFGIAREQAVGRNTGELRLWESHDALHETARRLATDRQIIAQPARLRVADGSVRQFLLTMSMIDGADTPLYVANVIDQTDRLAAEQAQRELNAQLEARVSERTRELSEAVDRLRHAQEELVNAEKLASLGAMVAGISHELNTPVGNTVTVSTTLRQRVGEFAHELGSGGLKRSQLEAFVGAVTEMATLLERSSLRAGELIASFKQVAIDQASEQRRCFDLRTLADDVVTTVSPGFKRLPWVIQVDIAEGINCDSFPGPLGQILTNLVSNAVHHAFDERSEGTIVVRASLAGEAHIRLEVADDGIGMSRQVQARVFDPFFTTKLGKGGSGLGLSVCHRIATNVLGGTLTLASEPGQGSTFTLLFPRVAPGRV